MGVGFIDPYSRMAALFWRSEPLDRAREVDRTDLFRISIIVGHKRKSPESTQPTRL
jgi:hypothetical protein